MNVILKITTIKRIKHRIKYDAMRKYRMRSIKYRKKNVNEK